MHALLNGVALDIIAVGLDGISPAARGMWFPTSKKQSERAGFSFDKDEREAPSVVYPATTYPYGSCSFNTTCIQLVFNQLLVHYPYQLNHIAECVKDFALLQDKTTIEFAGEDKLQAHKQNPHLDNGLPIPVGIATGLYSRLMNLTLDVMHDLTNSVSYAIGMGSQQARTSCAISYLVWSLLETGYFGAADLQDLIELKLISGNLTSLFKTYIQEAHQPDYWSKFVTTDLIEELSHSEKILAEACFYLCRISTQFKEEVTFSTVPKENLIEVLNTDNGYVDLAMLFGVLACASEQTGEEGCYKLVIPEALCYESPYTTTFKAIFEDIN